MTGKALLPFFGSKVGIGSEEGGRLRFLHVTGTPPAGTLCEWIEQDTSRTPVIVLHPGTMSNDVRLSLMTLMRQRDVQPAVILDDAVLAYLGELAQSRYELFMGVALQFCSGNPYWPPSGDCPIEMFYGRSAQLKELQDREGTCLVYGGRQLGKSALLRTVEREFNKGHDQIALYVDLKHPVDGSGRAEVVWNELVTALTKAGIIKPMRSVPRTPPRWSPRRSTTGSTPTRPGGSWSCSTRPTPTSTQMPRPPSSPRTRLKNPMDERARRFKVVWTGLHQVQRFATVSNHPIAHLGAPAVIGFLRARPGPAPHRAPLRRPRPSFYL